MDNNKKSRRNVRWSPSKSSVNNMRRKKEDWTIEADRLAVRRDRFIEKENKKKERQLQKALEKEKKLEAKNLVRLNRARERETNKWMAESAKEGERQTRFMDRLHAKTTRARERKEFKKWQKEIRANERRIRKLVPFKVVRTFTNANARFTTYFDTYTVYVYGPTDPVAVFQKAIDLTIEDRGLVDGDKIRVIVSHPYPGHIRFQRN